MDGGSDQKYSRKSLECLGVKDSSQQSCPVLSATPNEWIDLTVQCLLGDEEDSRDFCRLSHRIFSVDNELKCLSLLLFHR